LLNSNPLLPSSTAFPYPVFVETVPCNPVIDEVTEFSSFPDSRLGNNDDSICIIFIIIFLKGPVSENNVELLLIF
jgi:hypothetical protein